MRVGVKPSGQNFTCCRAAKAPGKKVCGKSKKVVDKDTLFGYNIPCQQRRAAPDKPNNGDLHSGSAVDSDSTCGSSILSSPTRKPQSQLAAVFSGHSAVGSAPRSGRGGRGFKSRCSDQKRPVHFVYWSFLISAAGFEQGGGMKCRKQSHSMALFSPRVPTSRKVYPGRSRNTFVYWSFFVFTAGFERARAAPQAGQSKAQWAFD